MEQTQAVGETEPASSKLHKRLSCSPPGTSTSGKWPLGWGGEEAERHLPDLGTKLAMSSAEALFLCEKPEGLLVSCDNPGN